MKIESELIEVPKTIKVKESFEYYLLESIDDLESEVFLEKLRRFDGRLEMRTDVRSKFMLSPELEQLLKYKVPLGERVFIRLHNDEAIFIDHREIDPFKCMGGYSTQILIGYDRLFITIDQFIDEK